VIVKNQTDQLLDDIMSDASRVISWVRLPADEIQTAALNLAERVKALDEALTDGAPFPGMWTQRERA
jgi:hypothetical protein